MLPHNHTCAKRVSSINPLSVRNEPRHKPRSASSNTASARHRIIFDMTVEAIDRSSSNTSSSRNHSRVSAYCASCSAYGAAAVSSFFKSRAMSVTWDISSSLGNASANKSRTASEQAQPPVSSDHSSAFTDFMEWRPPIAGVSFSSDSFHSEAIEVICFINYRITSSRIMPSEEESDCGHYRTVNSYCRLS